MTAGIYLLTHIATGRKYVGQSRNLAVRKATHAGGNSGGAISRAIVEFGWDAFHYEVIETCEHDQLAAAEARWIAHHDCLTPKGFNRIKPGGRADHELEGGPGARRQARHRRKGRQIHVVLHDKEAIRLLEELTEKLGGVKAAVTHALHAAALTPASAARRRGTQQSSA